MRRLERGTQAVRYYRSFPSVWPGLSEYVEATVSTWDAGFEARCHTSFPNAEREQWNTRKVFATRDEAAAYAAAFVLVSEELVAAILSGETPVGPKHLMRDTCARELAASEAYRAAQHPIETATSHRERLDAKEALAAAIRDGESAWYRAHDFRDFLAPEKPTLAPATEEDDHDHRNDSAA